MLSSERPLREFEPPIEECIARLARTQGLSRYGLQWVNDFNQVIAYAREAADERKQGDEVRKQAEQAYTAAQEFYMRGPKVAGVVMRRDDVTIALPIINILRSGDGVVVVVGHLA